MDLDTRRVVGSGPLTARYDEALLFASEHHREQLRKGSRIPYLSHLLSVSSLVLEHGGGEDAAIAGLLHDAVEDAPGGSGPEFLAEIRRRFGSVVADTVASCSDGLDERGERHGNWAQRKLAYVHKLRNKSLDAALVTAADKTHNARAISSDLAVYGREFLRTFNPCEHQLVWYYQEVRDRLAVPLTSSTILRSLDQAVTELVQGIGTDHVAGGDEPPACSCSSARASGEPVVGLACAGSGEDPAPGEPVRGKPPVR